MNLPESQLQLLMIVGGIVAVVVIFFLLRALGGGGRRSDMMQPPPGMGPQSGLSPMFSSQPQAAPLGMRENLSDDAAYQAYWASYGVDKETAVRSLRQLAMVLGVPLSYLRPGDRIADYGERGQKVLQGLTRMEHLIEHFGGHVQIEKIEDLVKAFAQIGPIMMTIKHQG